MTDELIENTNDYELIMLYREEDEDAKNILYLKYKFIIDILIKKYQKLITALNIDMQEIFSECTVGFSDGLRSYQEDRDSTLPSFISLCVERRLTGVIRKYNREKYKIINDSYSLDYFYEQFGRPLMDILVDNSNEPLDNMMEEEEYKELLDCIKKSLSQRENQVFSLMISGFEYHQIATILHKTTKQIDNTMQRIKLKIKDILENREK